MIRPVIYKKKYNFFGHLFGFEKKNISFVFFGRQRTGGQNK